ncbi:hypothetical protein BM1_06423 [Bipolaris maydis]|nr:hypothetical protein BM1_06423 [Bipolaris maydis]
MGKSKASPLTRVEEDARTWCMSRIIRIQPHCVNAGRAESPDPYEGHGGAQQLSVAVAGSGSEWQSAGADANATEIQG